MRDRCPKSCSQFPRNQARMMLLVKCLASLGSNRSMGISSTRPRNNLIPTCSTVKCSPHPLFVLNIPLKFVYTFSFWTISRHLLDCSNLQRACRVANATDQTTGCRSAFFCQSANCPSMLGQINWFPSIFSAIKPAFCIASLLSQKNLSNDSINYDQQ